MGWKNEFPVKVANLKVAKVAKQNLNLWGATLPKFIYCKFFKTWTLSQYYLFLLLAKQTQDSYFVKVKNVS